MNSRTKLTLWAAALLVLSASQPASSNTCNSHEFYCLSDTVYQFCLDGSSTANSQPLVCPSGTKCSSDCYEPCLPENITPCIRCNINTTFYCPNDHSFQMCLGDDVAPHPNVYECSKGTVCSNYCENECTAKACNPVICAAEGKVANPLDPKKYYLCTKRADNTYSVTEYTCPGLSLFEIDKCGSEPTTTTTPRPKYDCRAIGRFPDPSGVTGYILCALDSNNKLQGTYFPCPKGTVFNAATLKCTTTTTTTRPGELTTTKPVQDFVCDDYGKFADPRSCNNYILCTSLDDTVFRATYYKCPSPSYYDSESFKCTTTRPVSCPSLSRAALRSALSFRCSSNGRFEDPATCNHYYLCVAMEDHYVSFYFPCPGASQYNPETRKCTNVNISCMK